MKKNEIRLARLISNPFYCLKKVHPTFAIPHEIMVTKSKWISANENLIKEIGIKQFLQELLKNLEGDFVTGVDLEGKK